MLSNRIKRSAFFAATLVLVSATACNPASKATPKNFIAGLNSHFADHPDCLFPDGITLPFETTDPAKTKQLDALVDAQLLTVAVEHDIHASRYEPTEAGSRVAPRFCYGHRTVTAIDSFTPPAQANGFPETQVVYRFTIDDVPVWAKSAAMRAAFPAMAINTSGNATGKATLAGTMAGWQVPD